jgi:serine/threonine protein kinase
MAEPGATIGTYHVLAKIGEGGMGVVYLGDHTLLGQRFFNEARAVTRIADPSRAPAAASIGAAPPPVASTPDAALPDAAVPVAPSPPRNPSKPRGSRPRPSSTQGDHATTRASAVPTPIDRGD